jgi:hypothetical protein
VESLKIDYAGIKNSFVELLEPYDWQWFGTLEFSPKKPLKDSMRAKLYCQNYVKNFLDQVVSGNALSYFFAVERFKSSFFTHVHFLLSGICKGMSEKEAGKIIGAPWWEKYHGYCYLEKFNSKMGAAGYLAKYVTKDLCDWYFRLKSENKTVNIFPSMR